MNILKNGSTLIFILLICILCCGCERSTEKEPVAGIREFSKETISVYENLINATDEQVTNTLGMGTVDYAPGEDAPSDSILWQRRYDQCPIGVDGNTIVRYFLPDYNEEGDEVYQENAGTVSSIIMSASIPKGQEQEFIDSIVTLLGEPNQETMVFDSEKEYQSNWKKEKCNYLLWYAPSNEEGKLNQVIFTLLDKSFDPTAE